MKVLFLDIDGVLNSHMWIQNGGKFGRGPKHRSGEPATVGELGWHPTAVNELRRIVTETGCHIVISSSWRGYGDRAIETWQSMFACYGWPDAPVIGETPDLPCWNGTVYIAKIRGDEVKAWLDTNPHVTQYACVDDDGDFHADQNLVQTDITFGLTRIEGNELIKRLGSPATTHEGTTP